VGSVSVEKEDPAMMKLHLARYAGFALILSVVAPALAQRTDPPDTPPQIGRFRLPTALVTPVLSTDQFHGGTWICSALNVGDEPLNITMRAFRELGQEVAFEDHTCELEPGKACSRLWTTGIAGHYCKVTLFGSKNSIRAGLQVTDTNDDGFSLFAEAR
jgi:hypothetical protein